MKRWLVALAACAHNVPQDRSTGPDGTIDGAKKLHLDREAAVRGIVTYPGGDRVDWTTIELPQGQQGTLSLKLTWQAPRPSGRVAFDVFDQWHAPVVAETGRRGRTHTATVWSAAGTYFVRVYAPRRSDAGAYKLAAAFQPDIHEVIDIPYPPRLPAVPKPDPVCAPFDVRNPACATVCDPMAPPGASCTSR